MVRKGPPTSMTYLQRAGWGVCPHPGVLLRQDPGDQSTGNLQPGPEFNINVNIHCEVRGIISSWIEIHSDF